MIIHSLTKSINSTIYTGAYLLRYVYYTQSNSLSVVHINGTQTRHAHRTPPPPIMRRTDIQLPLQRPDLQSHPGPLALLILHVQKLHAAQSMLGRHAPGPLCRQGYRKLVLRAARAPVRRTCPATRGQRLASTKSTVFADCVHAQPSRSVCL